MKKLLSFHGDPAIKQKYVSRLEEHRRLEHLVQGTGWDGSAVKGCAVGCTLENYSHAAYETKLGLPEWLARLEDYLFEQLPKTAAEKFAVDLLAVIPVGVDVEPVRHLLAIERQELALERLKDNKEPYAVDCRNAINLVIAWHNQIAQGSPTESAARSAAWSAARSTARSAARSAVRSAAWSAVRSAAWSAAWSATESNHIEWEAAWSATESNHIEWEAATLLRLLSELK